MRAIDDALLEAAAVLVAKESDLVQVQLLHEALRERTAQVLQQTDRMIGRILDELRKSLQSRLGGSPKWPSHHRIPFFVQKAVGNGKMALAPSQDLLAQINAFLDEHADLLKAHVLVDRLLDLRHEVKIREVDAETAIHSVEALQECVRNKVLSVPDIEAFLSIPPFSAHILRIWDNSHSGN